MATINDAVVVANRWLDLSWIYIYMAYIYIYIAYKNILYRRGIIYIYIYVYIYIYI